MRNPYGKAAQYSQCGSKKRYRDEKHANQVRKWREGDGAGRLRTYPCGICKGWHLTSSREVAS